MGQAWRRVERGRLVVVAGPIFFLEVKEGRGDEVGLTRDGLV